MITPKQRAFLKKEAHGMTPTVLIGKGGISDELIRQVNEQLEKRELVKGKCLDTSPVQAAEAAEILLNACSCDFVQKIGSVFVLYRPAKKPVLQLPR